LFLRGSEGMGRGVVFLREEKILSRLIYGSLGSREKREKDLK
jgi:hypothetical protein